MNFKKWVKSIQTAGYNGARMVPSYIGLILRTYNICQLQQRGHSWFEKVWKSSWHFEREGWQEVTTINILNFCQNLNLNYEIIYPIRKPSISTVQFAEVKEKDVESGLRVENPQQKRLRKVLSAVSRFKHQPRRFRPTSDFDKAERAQLNARKEENQNTGDGQNCGNWCSNFFGGIKSSFSQYYSHHKGCINKSKAISTKFLPCAFDSGSDMLAAYNHYM